MQTIWVEIPALNLERAKEFYENVFGQARTEIITDGHRRIVIFPGPPNVSLNETADFVPTIEGSIPYFHVDEPFAVALNRVTGNGGKMIDPTEERGSNGFFALVADSEGNAVTLHSTQP
jgi:hypothetical protein